jgi:hypothetical protein
MSLLVAARAGDLIARLIDQMAGKSSVIRKDAMVPPAGFEPATPALGEPAKPSRLSPEKGA